MSTAAKMLQLEDYEKSIPKELQDLEQWVCWKVEVRDGKPTKVPYIPGPPPHERAKTNDPNTWADFQAAYGYASDARNGFAGIGFVFHESDPYVGVDFDGCLDANGSLADWAAKWVLRLGKRSYSETSPSGRGVKFWVRGKLPGPGGKRIIPGGGGHTGIEVYDKGRFFATTGDVFNLTEPIEDHQATIAELYAWVKERPERKTTPTPPSSPTIPFPTGDVEARARAYLATVDPAVSGQGGHDATMRAACVLVRFGIENPDAVFRILRED